MNKAPLAASAALVAMLASSGAATLANRYSFDVGAELTDSVGGNTGILMNGATVSGGALQLPGTGTGTGGNHMTFTSTINIGATFGTSGTGVTIESWYTDNNTGTWGKLFHFGTNAAGQELAYTHTRGNGQMSGVDRGGAQLLNQQVAPSIQHHLVITVSADGNLNTWVDNTQLLTNIDTNDLSNVNTGIEAIGATSWNDPGMNGTVDEFRIWSGELTAAEVANNFAAGPNVVPEPAGIAFLTVGSLLILRRRR